MKTVEDILVAPVRFRRAVDLIFSGNPQKTNRTAQVWREAALASEILGEVTPHPMNGRIVYEVKDAHGEPVGKVTRLRDTFAILRKLDRFF